MTKVDAVAKPMTLGDVLSISRTENVIIMNELNEVLLELTETNDYVCPFTKHLKQEFLNRPVVSTGISGNDFVIEIAGEEDAE